MIKSVSENPKIRSAYPVMEKHLKRRNSLRFFCDCSPFYYGENDLHKLIIGEIISCKHRTNISFSIHIFDFLDQIYRLSLIIIYWKKRDGKQMLWKLIFIFKCNQKSIATERNSIKYRLSQKLFKNQNSTPDAKNGRFLLNFSCPLYLPSFKLKLLILNKTLEYSIALAIQHYLWNKKDANKLFNGNKKYFSLINSIY